MIKLVLIFRQLRIKKHVFLDRSDPRLIQLATVG